jgi:serine/threonine-protein kinase
MMSVKEDLAATLEPGSRIDDRYEIIGILGQGAMGTVYDAHHLNLERRVAIKVLHEHRLHDEGTRQRFDREARTLAAVSHPNIVGITDYGFWRDEPYIVMERLEGCTLSAVLKAKGPIGPRRTADFMLQLLSALEHAHERKLVHRDLKPGNVWVERGETGRERLRLLDFGIAKFIDDRGTNVTADGVVAGTPTYMSPEQASASHVDARSDVYSAGVVMFQMLAGRPPFQGRAADIIGGHLREDPPSLLELCPGLHPDWASLCGRALEKNPKDRFQRAIEFARAIVLLPREALGAGKDARVGTEPPEARRMPDPAMGPREPGAPKDTRPRSTPSKWALVAVVGGAIAAAAGLATLVPAPDEEPDGEASPPDAVARAPGTGTSDERGAIEEAGANTTNTSPAGLAPDTASPPPAEPEAPLTPSLPPDPWQTRPASPDLQAIRTRLAAGGTLDPADGVRLRLFGREHPNDPRPRLLRAHDAVNRRWFSSALETYEALYSADPDARGAPEMLEDLVSLATRETVADRAAALVRRVYGAAAVPAIDRAIAAGGDARTLASLRRSLASE